jgi:uncharacterized protein
MTEPGTEKEVEPRSASRRGIGSLEVFTAALIALLIGQRWVSGLFDDSPALQTFATIFVSICVQAFPFLVLGVVLSAFLSAYVPPSFFARVLPKQPALAVPVAASAGVVLPGCECASVPVAGSLVSRGVAPAAAFAFLLSAPAINPIVLVSTAVAFPGDPQMVWGRLLASLIAACVMGWLWVRFGKSEWVSLPARPSTEGQPRADVFRAAAQHDFLHAGGFLVIGGLTAATLNVIVPQSWLDSVAALPIISALALGALAVMMAICSEADAFVAASLTQFSLTSRLVFLVVGPMVDVKLFALQAGTFGRSFALRFSPTTFVVCVVSALLVGGWLL